MIDMPHLPQLPQGLRVYAIGDIHGRVDLLDQLNEKIQADLAVADCERVITIFLGDYVDRGPNSAEVIERLATGQFPGEILPLRGNHEAVFLDFLSNPEVFGSWRRFGGLATLSSYGVDVSDAMRGRGFEDARLSLLENLPKHHKAFLESTKKSATIGDFFFCHAGVRLGVALDLQSEKDLLWIRDDFLDQEAPFEKFIIHGHTPVIVPEALPNRINIDTGAYLSDKLTAVVIEGDASRFLQT